MYDLLLKGGEVVDPMQGIHDVRDVAIKDGKIAAVARDIPGAEARDVIPVGGKVVAPGLIDIHCHPSGGLTHTGLPPDDVGLDTGITLLCDGGSAGAANFETLRRFIMEPARTEMFAFLNLGKTGLVTSTEIRDQRDIDLEQSKHVVEANRDVIKGIKLRAIKAFADGMGIKGVEIAKKLAVDLKLPLMVHIGDGRERAANETMDDFTRATVKLLEKGDILIHFMTPAAGGLILPDGKTYPELRQARDRGVILDSSHGMGHFSFPLARLAIQQGLLPTVMSTDLTIVSLQVVQSLAVIMSKFLNLGLSIDQVVEATTSNPAKALGEEARRGGLKPGMRADITVMEILEGDYIFSDGKARNTLKGKLLLEPRLVLSGGVISPCRSRYQIPPVYPTTQR